MTFKIITYYNITFCTINFNYTKLLYNMSNSSIHLYIRVCTDYKIAFKLITIQIGYLNDNVLFLRRVRFLAGFPATTKYTECNF